jgi:glycosyltransferase involved in cell wall biosynthesis
MPAVPRHVALNALWLDPGRSSGTETYLRGLVPALARARPGVRLTLATTRRGADALVAEGWTNFCAIVRVPTDEGQRIRRLASELLRFPDIARRRGADLLHSLANTGPVVAPAPHVLTIHDVIFFHHATMPRSTILATRAIVGAAARTAAQVITVSESSREDLVATLGLSPERVVTVHNGAGRAPSVAPAPEAPLRARLGVAPGARLLLCVAALRPHKNQELLVQALPALDDDVVLVLAGHEEPYADTLRALAAESGVADRVCFAGYVTDAELEALYAIAACAAFPTRAEGFGLPVLEALRRGVPVACSDLPVLREVGGDVPRYFDPGDPAGAAAAIREAMGGEAGAGGGASWAAAGSAVGAVAGSAAAAGPAGPAGGAGTAGSTRAAAAAAGLERAARFTWEAAAEGTFAAYERALAASAR